MATSYRKVTIYVLSIGKGGNFSACALPMLDNTARATALSFHAIEEKTAMVFVVSPFAVLSRSRATEIAAFYLTGKCQVERIEFPQPPKRLRDIIQFENRKKNRR